MAFAMQPIDLAVLLVAAGAEEKEQEEELRAQEAQALPFAGVEGDDHQRQEMVAICPEGGRRRRREQRPWQFPARVSFEQMSDIMCC